MSDLWKEMESLINRHSLENGSDTPDFILAHYLRGCLDVFDRTVRAREEWYGRKTSRLNGQELREPADPVERSDK